MRWMRGPCAFRTTGGANFCLSFFFSAVISLFYSIRAHTFHSLFLLHASSTLVLCVSILKWLRQQLLAPTPSSSKKGCGIPLHPKLPCLAISKSYSFVLDLNVVLSYVTLNKASTNDPPHFVRRRKFKNEAFHTGRCCSGLPLAWRLVSSLGPRCSRASLLFEASLKPKKMMDGDVN